MIHIAFVSTLAYNLFFPGSVRQAGGHTRFVNLVRRFATHPDYRVSCVVGDFGQTDVMEEDGVRLVKAPIDRPFSFFRVFQTLRKLEADIFVDFCASPRLMLFCALKFLDKTRYVFLTGSDNDVTEGYRGLANAVFYHAYLCGLKHADAIVCQYPKQAALLKKYHKLSSHCVISPYFDIESRPKKGKKKHILWVGRSAYYKNPRAYVSLIKRFPEEQFVMICNKSPDDNGFMADMENKAALPNNLKFIDYVEYPEMQYYYESAKLLVNTSDFEGFPNTFIEAAMNETPVLSLIVDPNGMFSEFKGGVCCRGDKKLFYRYFRELVSNSRMLQEYGENAFRYAERYHQLDVAVEKIDRIIRGVLERRE
jgi:glycosyltransferase involved in cell wall biosynthesis